MLRFALFILVVYGRCCFTDAQCSFPSAFQNTAWHDSMKGTLTFTANAMTGYTVTTYGTTLTSWDCYDVNYFTSENLLLFRATTTFTALSITWNVYLCFQMTEESTNSYSYYHVAGQEANAGQERVFVGPGASSYTKDQICNTTSMASGSAFIVMVKQGSESAAKKDCPTPLLGRFDFTYTDSGSTQYCNNASDPEHMNVCTDKTTLAFPTPCSTKSPVYASGSVYCVASKTVGTDSVVALYNPDTTVDDSTTYRFSCMAISEDSTKATVIYNNCTDHMTSTVAARDHAGNTIGAVLTLSPYVFCQGGCLWPSTFRSSTWRDNTRGDLTFLTDTMTGFSFTSYGTTVNNWECLDNTTFSTDGKIILKAIDTVTVVGTTYVPFLCLQTTQVVQDVSYYYYQMHDQQANAAYERVFMSIDGTLTDRNTICSSSSVPTQEFHFMLKSGSESSAKQTCPAALFARMDYTYTSDSGATQCDSSTDNWDVCTDRQVMSFDYATCSQQMAYSDSGVVWCVGGITSTYEYVVVYNTDSSPTYRFTCLVVSTDGLTASMVYNNCTVTQTPTSFAKAADGITNIGALLTMTQTETCPITTTAVTTAATTAGATTASGGSGTTTEAPGSGASGEGGGGGGGSIIPIIAGAVAGVLAIAVIVAITIYCLKRKKSKTGVSHTSIEKIAPSDNPESNGHALPVIDNPALTINPPRNTLTPLPPKLDVIDVSGPTVPPIRV